MRWRRLAPIAGLTCLLAQSAAAVDPPPADPEARRTWIAERREEAMQKREEFLSLSPEQQEKIRADRLAQREERRRQRRENDPRRAVELQGPFPLPVAQGGKPAGASCPAGESCTLVQNPSDGQVLVITAVWAASKVECDGVSAATPPGGSAVSPWWRCAQAFSVTGAGAGYLGFLADK